ncbi:MAG: hypothetical protein AAF721_02665 [Myxococcota bacterium]
MDGGTTTHTAGQRAVAAVLGALGVLGFAACDIADEGHDLTIVVEGRGLVVATDPDLNGVTCTDGDSPCLFPNAGTVALTAVPDDGWMLRGWEDCAGASDEGNQAQFWNIDGARACKAVFEESVIGDPEPDDDVVGEEVELSITVAGPGAISVQASGRFPELCREDTCTFVYEAGTGVTVTAQADSGFEWWGDELYLPSCGATAGSGAGGGQANEFTLQMDADAACSTRFYDCETVPEVALRYTYQAEDEGMCTAFLPLRFGAVDIPGLDTEERSYLTGLDTLAVERAELLVLNPLPTASYRFDSAFAGPGAGLGYDVAGAAAGDWAEVTITHACGATHSLYLDFANGPSEPPASCR